MKKEGIHTSEAMFYHDLERLQGVYAGVLIEEARKNADLLISVYEQWQRALKRIADFRGISLQAGDAIPHALEVDSVQRLQRKEKDLQAKTVIGIAGPGAAGKESIEKALAFPKVINTTTRQRRDYEEDGKHYRFITEEQYAQIVDQNAFVTKTDRPGRGRYGIQRQDLEAGLQREDALLIEENPRTLAQASIYIREHLPQVDFTLAYILPPEPVQPHLAVRLANRCLIAGEDYRAAIESTLGALQVDEFLSLIDAGVAGTSIVFVVNDSIERASSVILSTVGKRT